ncbi:MAG TPA: MipA/OmpV family protein [Microvirga sp.]|jgi:outer membrane scaffolding protein for murein synthesis (MipA/OmpV family)
MMYYRLLSAAVVLFMSTGAGAADLAPAEPARLPVSDTWLMTLKGNVRVGPSFPGSDEFSVFGFPSVSFRRASSIMRFSAPDDGLSFSVLDRSSLRIGVVGRLQGGRDYEDDRRLFGLSKVDWAVEAGLFAEFWATDWLRARAEVRRGFNGHEGFAGDLGLDLVHRFGAVTASLGPRLSLRDDEFMRTYFGVTPVEAALNGAVTPYRPTGGIYSVGGVASLSYDWTPQWSTSAYLSYNRLVGDAADSPIVRQLGSEHQFGGGVTISYTFDTGLRWP